MKHKSNHHLESGAVSMLTVIFISILLTIITLAFVRLSVTERRQATDNDLTTRAYYAAESGVEDAKVAIGEYLEALSTGTTPPDLKGDECEPAGGSGVLSAELKAEYTCQLINLAPDSYEDDLERFESVQIPLNAAANYNRIRISWHKAGADYDGNYNLRNSSDLPSIDNWISSEYPAMLRVTLFSTPKNGPLNRSNIDDIAGFLNPRSTGLASVSVASFDRSIHDVSCSAGAASGDYACSLDIINLSGVYNPSNRLNYLRVKSLYRGSHIKVELLNNNTLVNIENVQAVVDVTARANDVLRRVQARIPLLGRDPYPFPDYAIITSNSICKNVAVTNKASDFDDINPGFVTAPSPTGGGGGSIPTGCTP